MRETFQDVPDFIEQVAENRYIFEIEQEEDKAWGDNGPKTFQDTTEESPTTKIEQSTTANNEDW